ncbi:MAG: hypothetical protein EBY09_11375 [Verrucomicrobia bacterium]|nr:hypothetical protein [Verrucomicrobiota bacterium]NBU09887.1 hypothetical protein [Pseudomonadota bacterium]NDA67224.1 hypothetical protein [Verrucomicrobiota bacterium]NDD37097.1 hypothetical protein [Verrucomicrobiota bacterium]NDE96939.1 hypothetical protein [Verrucomicrobiota bacterium]
MDDFAAFASRDYLITLGLLVFARGMDFLSTWFATPTLVLEANPLAKWLGWKWGIACNLLLCLATAHWPLAGLILVTTSLLVAARNFKSAWLMRALGERDYSLMVGEAMSRTNRRSYCVSVMGETLLFGLVGLAVVVSSDWSSLPLAIGTGMLAYAVAVAFYSLLVLWRR